MSLAEKVQELRKQQDIFYEGKVAGQSHSVKPVQRTEGVIMQHVRKRLREQRNSLPVALSALRRNNGD